MRPLESMFIFARFIDSYKVRSLVFKIVVDGLLPCVVSLLIPLSCDL